MCVCTFISPPPPLLCHFHPTSSPSPPSSSTSPSSPTSPSPPLPPSSPSSLSPPLPPFPPLPPLSPLLSLLSPPLPCREEICSGTVVTYNDCQEILCQKCTDVAFVEEQVDHTLHGSRDHTPRPMEQLVSVQSCDLPEVM